MNIRFIAMSAGVLVGSAMLLFAQGADALTDPVAFPADPVVEERSLPTTETRVCPWDQSIPLWPIVPAR